MESVGLTGRLVLFLVLVWDKRRKYRSRQALTKTLDRRERVSAVKQRISELVRQLDIGDLKFHEHLKEIEEFALEGGVSFSELEISEEVVDGWRMKYWRLAFCTFPLPKNLKPFFGQRCA